MALLVGFVLALLLVGSTLVNSSGVLNNNQGSTSKNTSKNTGSTSPSFPITLNSIPKDLLSPIRPYIPGGAGNQSNAPDTDLADEEPEDPTPDIPSDPTPKPQVTPNATPKPTPKPTPTPAPLPSFCKPYATTTNGRPVISVASLEFDIQKTLDCFKNNDTQGGAVYIPAGTYIVKSKIRVYSNVTLFGDGIDKTILQLDASLLTNPGGILGNDINYGHRNIVVRDMTMRGLFQESGLQNCCVGIILRQLEGGLLYNIKVEGFSWHGIWLAYKKQTRENKDTVKDVRISNCQILNNRGAAVELDSPTSYSIVDNCLISGNNQGPGDDKRSGAAISFFMDEDGFVTKNKVLNNTIKNNYFRGISLIARNGITAIKTTRIADNAVCYNTVENNADAGITDGNSEDNAYIGNKIINNNDKRDGRVQTGAIRYWDYSTLSWFTTAPGSSINMVENINPGATSPECIIPTELATIPPKPPIPSPSVQGVSTDVKYSGGLVNTLVQGLSNLVKQLLHR